MRKTNFLFPPLALFLFVSLACGALPNEPGDAGVRTDANQPDAWVDPDLAPDLIEARPYGLYVPTNTDDSALPLVITLHGFGSYGAEQANYSGLRDYADQRHYILAYPDGVSINGMRTWNASCCGYQTPVANIDDVAYLRAVVADIASQYPVDRRRIYAEGLSNGGFMAHRLACDAADIFAAISSHAGTMWVGEDNHCEPSRPVPVLHSHGTSDETVLYAGGTFVVYYYSFDYIGAEPLVEFWRAHNGCTDTPTLGQGDYELNLEGNESETFSYTQGCQDDAEVVFWKMNGASHVPSITDAYRKDMIDFFYAHPMPE